MKTSSFRTYFGPGRVSIARWAPRNCPAGFRIYRALAPGDWCKLPNGKWVDDTTFIAGYADQLTKLDPAEVWRELHDLHPGQEPVLMCWEAPPFHAKNWCHRTLVSEWFLRTLGHRVEELDNAPHLTKPPPPDLSRLPGI